MLVFNGDKNGENGDAYAIPINSAEKLTQGLIECGIEYQKLYGKDIGFDADKHLEELLGS